MSPARCRHCGQSIRAGRIEQDREYFCCPGCALRARMPVDEAGNYPVTPDLIAALVVGFLYFNQLLAWGLGSLLAGQGKAILAQRFALGGLVLAFLTWLVLLLLQRRVGPLRGKDWMIAAVSFLLVAASLRSTMPNGGLLAAASGIFVAWSFRGVVRTKAETTPR